MSAVGSMDKPQSIREPAALQMGRPDRTPRAPRVLSRNALKWLENQTVSGAFHLFPLKLRWRTMDEIY